MFSWQMVFLKTLQILGGRFGPEKKYLAPPPPKKFPADTLPATPPPLCWENAPLLAVFNKNRRPPPPGTSPPPFPSPEQKKIKNIRNVHDWLPERLRIKAHRFSRWLCKPYSEMPYGCV